MMKFGVCGDVARARVAAKAGYDYWECSVMNALRPLEADAVFKAELEQLKSVEIPCEVANCFIPSDLKITGPDMDDAKLLAYVQTTCSRAQQAGIEVIVFGSGGARQIPEGFDRDKAHEQIVSFCRMVGPVAEDHNVTIAIEPLNQAECNVLTSVAECAELAQEVNHPAIQLLVDFYHLLKADDSIDSIVTYGAFLRHVHIATKEQRMQPGGEPCDFTAFFGALKAVGYDDRMSIEGQIDEDALPASLELIRGLAGL